MLSLDLDQIDEQALRSLEANQVPESLRLEFKRELDLSTREKKREAAKDVSALANTAGGRIVYGVEEKKLPDGARLAGPLCPLKDGQVDSVLADVIVGAIHPRPRFRTRKVDIGTGGFVLIVEVYDSYGRDLHLVSGYSEDRFYRRHESGVYPMSEPEIREAYMRIAASRVDLEASLQKLLDAELTMRSTARESLILVPWYGAPNLIAPRELSSFRYWLETGPLAESFVKYFRDHLKPFTSGFRAVTDSPQSPKDSSHYLAVHKNGLLHLSSRIFVGDEHNRFGALGVLERFIVLLQIASELLSRVSYWGPVRVFHVMRFSERFKLTGVEILRTQEFGDIPAGEYHHTLYELRLKELGHSYGAAAKELIDQVFNSAGVAECPWFDPQGEPNQSLKAVLKPTPGSSAHILFQK